MGFIIALWVAVAIEVVFNPPVYEIKIDIPEQEQSWALG